MFQLRRPSEALAASFATMRDACIAAGDNGWNARNAAAHQDVSAYVALLNRRAAGQDVPNGWVPESTFWIVEDDAVIGELQLRHALNDQLKEVGGNIGYVTHPAHRNRGVATFALREGARFLKTLGLTEALITCADDNAASIRVIEKCGGTRIADGCFNGAARRRYLLPT